MSFFLPPSEQYIYFNIYIYVFVCVYITIQYWTGANSVDVWTSFKPRDLRRSLLSGIDDIKNAHRCSRNGQRRVSCLCADRQRVWCHFFFFFFYLKKQNKYRFEQYKSQWNEHTIQILPTIECTRKSRRIWTLTKFLQKSRCKCRFNWSLYVYISFSDKILNCYLWFSETQKMNTMFNGKQTLLAGRTAT